MSEVLNPNTPEGHSSISADQWIESVKSKKYLKGDFKPYSMILDAELSGMPLSEYHEKYSKAVAVRQGFFSKIVRLAQDEESGLVSSMLGSLEQAEPNRGVIHFQALERLAYGVFRNEELCAEITDHDWDGVAEGKTDLAYRFQDQIDNQIAVFEQRFPHHESPVKEFFNSMNKAGLPKETQLFGLLRIIHATVNDEQLATGSRYVIETEDKYARV